MDSNRGGAGARVGVVERLLALLGLVVTSPVTALAAAGIRMSSPGPAIYRASRVGRGGRDFTMFKLRTMHVGADVVGGITGSGDARVFPVGALLRRLKVDEIPQLVNVLRGDMCFIGPRPEAREIVNGDYEAWMWETLTVPPGIVGPGSLSYFLDEASLPADPGEAEVYYRRSVLPRKLARDLVYVRRRTLAYRIELLLRTLAGISGTGFLFEKQRRREDQAAEAILAECEAS